MTFTNYHPAHLDESRLRTVQALESDLRKVVVALQPDAPTAQLTDKELTSLKEIEQRLGVVIVAYEPS